jgi:hypothetical protein
MSFWRKEVVQFALDQETRKQIDEQLEWIAREPANPRPYYHLAQLYRIEGKQDEALGLLLESVRLHSGDAAEGAPAHLALAEIYAIRGDYPAAWRHARSAERGGERRAVEMLERHGIKEL